MKFWTNLKIKLTVFQHYIPLLFKGELSLKHFMAFVRRLLLFLSKLQHNKFIKFGAGIRLDLYVPTFPSKAFFTAADKFKVFGEKLPCTGVLVSVTSACMYKCEHCYQRLDRGCDVSLNLLVNTVKRLQDKGIAFFNIEGGEPFLAFDRLKAVCGAIDNRSEIWVNSTGYGMSLEKLKQLPISGVMFSFHSPEPQGFNKFMGHDEAWQHLQNGIELCHAANIPIAINTCLMKDAFYDNTFERIMEIAKEKKVSLVQIIKPKPSGAWLENSEEFFSERDLKQAKRKINLYNHNRRYAPYPAISAQIIEEEPEVFGCTAGGTDRFYINAKGDVQPCEFLNISFGNIGEESFDIIYSKMRKCFDKPGICMLCEQSAVRISKIFKENNLSSLPLPPNLSEQVYCNWDTGQHTDLYKRAENYE